MGISDEVDKNEVVKSTKDSIYSKITSPLWGTFILSWLVWNWRIIYVSFFVNGEKIYEKYELLKIEYLIQKIYNGSYIYFQFPLFTDYIIYWFIGPILSTILILWIIPYISNLVYIRDIKKFKMRRIVAKREVERDIEKQFLIETQKDKNLIEKENKALEEMRKELEKKNKLIEEINDSKDSIELANYHEGIHRLNTNYPGWGIELEDFIYKKGGNTTPYKTYNGHFTNGYNKTEFITIFDSLGLVDLKEKSLYELTQKGKEYLLNHKLPPNEK